MHVLDVEKDPKYLRRIEIEKRFKTIPNKEKRRD